MPSVTSRPTQAAIKMPASQKQDAPREKRRRVVITGLGLVSPLGIGVEQTWSALCSGKSGVAPITLFDATDLKTRIAAEVKDFDPLDFFPKKEARRMERFLAFAVVGAKMALENANFSVNEKNAPRVGVFTGCGLGGLDMLERSHATLLSKGPGRVTPFFIPLMIGNMAPGMISMHTGALGPNCSVATACAAGTHAVGEAFRILERGDADVMITGGMESVITPMCLAGFNAMRALSTRNHEPEKASRPFDKDRDGFVVGEGAGLLVLEGLDHAQARGAPILAEVSGFGMSGDAYHLTAPPPDGRGAILCMQNALKDAAIAPEDVDYINAHGTSTPLNDTAEVKAIKAVFGDHAQKLAISSTKSMTGHLLGGAGGVETVFLTLTIAKGVIPPTINLENPEDECDLDFVPNTAREQKVRTGMSNSFGFGGTNGTVILKEFSE